MRGGPAVPRVRVPSDYDKYVDGSRASTGSARSWRRGGSSSRRRRVGSGRGRDDLRPGTRKNDLVLRLIHDEGVEPYEGSVGFVKAARSGMRTAVVSSSTTARRSPRGRHRGSVRGRGSTASSPSATICRASLRRTRSWPAPKALGVDPPTAAVFEDAQAGVQAGRAGKFGWVVGVDRTGQPMPCAITGPTSWSRSSPNCWSETMIGPDASRSSRGGSRARARPRPAGPDRVDLRALQRAHRPARQPRRGRAVWTPGTFLNSFYEVRPLPYAEPATAIPRRARR